MKFGYTGAYTAVPQGLVPEVVTAGDISQDPDQTYPSADDGVGVDLIPFDLTGAAFARWEMIIPGAPDIDLYLLDPAGDIVAASTSGGTDELIDFEVPEAGGIYTLVVHGWAVPTTTPVLPYNLSSWVIPATTGGSLSVTAPTAAVDCHHGDGHGELDGTHRRDAIPRRRGPCRTGRSPRQDAGLGSDLTTFSDRGAHHGGRPCRVPAVEFAVVVASEGHGAGT